MIINKLDSVEFRLKEWHDFTWLKKYGTAFWSVDETGSGCICIGMEDQGKKYFCKIAGVNTIERYQNNRFVPCSFSDWQLNGESYRAAVMAVSPDRNGRYGTFDEFFGEWKAAVRGLF